MLVPSAPCLLTELTGGAVPELADVRAAVAEALGDLVAAGADRVVVAARQEPGALSGFGNAPVGPTPRWPAVTVSGPSAPAVTSSVPGFPAFCAGPRPLDGPGWAHELGALLLARHGWRGAVEAVVTTDTVAGALACAASAIEPATRIAVLVLADGSATRGPRAPGGADPRGEDLDTRLLTDLRAGRVVTSTESDALAVGCRGLPGLTMFTALQVVGSATVDPAADPDAAGDPTAAADRTASTDLDAEPAARADPDAGGATPLTAFPDIDVRYAGAPLGVGYLVAVRPARAS